MFSGEVPAYHPNGIRDTARVAAQVVTGIGFIGAGTVLRNGPTVFGLTTAATLWMAASIGMACGSGMYDVATIATFVGCYFINSAILSELQLDIVLLNVSIRQMILILAVSSGSAFLGSFLPTFKISRKKPIDAINNR